MRTEGIVFTTSKVRLGRLQLSMLGFMRMKEYKLTPEILIDTFRYGKEEVQGMIVQKYDEYSVGMYYAKNESYVFRGDLESVRFVITTCWKQKLKKEA